MTGVRSSLDADAAEAWVRLLTEAVRSIAGAGEVHQAAETLAVLAAGRFDADVAGVSTFDRHGGKQRLAATDERLRSLDVATVEVPTSPLSAPLAPGSVLVVSDVATDPRWPEWGAAVRSQGARAALLSGLPAVQGHPLTLELYGHRSDWVAQLDQVAISHFATHVGLALEQAERRWNLEQAMQTRGVIGQAQGILMERYRLTGAQAMAYLRRQSQRSQLKVRDLAVSLVADREDEAIGNPRLDDTP